MQKKVKILGVKLNNITLNEALEKALKLAKRPQKDYICTPNPEILLEAQKNRKFMRVLNDSSLNIPDGAGIILAARFKRKPLKERVTGTDLMKLICQNSKQKIFLLGAKEGVAEEVRKRFPEAKIVGTYSGSPKTKEEPHIRSLINNSEAEILFVAFGAPAQELWISRNLKHLNKVNLAIGVGGAFDFLSDTKKRAPLLMRKTGLEWLYRLIKEPRRIKRIINATIVFPIKVLLKKQ